MSDGKGSVLLGGKGKGGKPVPNGICHPSYRKFGEAPANGHQLESAVIGSLSMVVSICDQRPRCFNGLDFL